MEPGDIPESWIGERVLFVAYDSHGRSTLEMRGWLKGVERDGIWFAKGFHSDSLDGLAAERAKFYAWDRVGVVSLHRE